LTTPPNALIALFDCAVFAAICAIVRFLTFARGPLRPKQCCDHHCGAAGRGGRVVECGGLENR
jgi:hypothetical protein